MSASHLEDCRIIGPIELRDDVSRRQLTASRGNSGIEMPWPEARKE